MTQARYLYVQNPLEVVACFRLHTLNGGSNACWCRATKYSGLSKHEQWTPPTNMDPSDKHGTLLRHSARIAVVVVVVTARRGYTECLTRVTFARGMAATGEFVTPVSNAQEDRFLLSGCTVLLPSCILYICIGKTSMYNIDIIDGSKQN